MYQNECVIYILLAVKGKVSFLCIWGSGGVAALILTSVLGMVSGELHSSVTLLLGTGTQVPNE